MAKYKITDSQSGKTLVISGSNPPTEQEAEQLFQSSGIRGSQSVQQKQGNPLEAIANVSKPLAQTLLPNVIQYSQNALQQIGQGNLIPSKPQGPGDILTQALGPLGEIPASLGVGSEMNKQQMAGGRELAQAVESAQGVAKAIPALAKNGINLVRGAGEFAKNAGEAKTLNPFQVTGYARNKAIEAAGNLDTSKVIQAGDEYVRNNPLAKDIWETFRPTVNENMSAKDLVYKMSKVWDAAYDKTGDVRNQAAAKLFNELYGAGKAILKDQAPDVAKQNALFKFLFNAPKNAQKASWLALKTTAIGKMLGL